MVHGMSTPAYDGSWVGSGLAEYRLSRLRWRADAHLPLAVTPGGERLHRPDCAVILSTIRVAEECIAWLQGGADEPSGNVPYPERVNGDAPTCRFCLARESKEL